ncbi:GGDEF domain-containing protein [Schlegelella sp. S2-27]|uniref:diguanylate cyclase n=1 Tax=Caldimonas mangrovi TaxID=2944811 RepID=A0ABT0YQS7_9BURK|nr:GGDEF domain-containing protein [Caldimonas mangrovi]MCM5681086.1 GGDEF domain-containing protein [Caldimonas mangrovi]
MDPDRSARIRLAQLHLYVDNHINDQFLAPALTVVAAALLTRWLPVERVTIWAVVELAIIAIYITCYRRFRAAKVQVADERVWRRRIAWAHGAHMLSWSSIIVWGWVPGDAGNLMFTMMIHLGLVSLTAAMSNPHRRLLMSDMSIPIVALLAPPLLSAGGFNAGLALLGVFYCMLMLCVAFKIHGTTAEAIELRLRNEELISKLEHQARLDGLTGVANRSHLLATGNAEIRRASRFGHAMALLMLDIDHFKEINDTHGHLVGDRVLKAVSDACALAVRHCDCLGRLGGEEFAVILPETDLPSALAAAERLRETVAALQLHHREFPLKTTVSIGVAMLQAPGEPLAQLLHRADVAMYRAKNSGRNRVEAEVTAPMSDAGPEAVTA